MAEIKRRMEDCVSWGKHPELRIIAHLMTMKQPGCFQCTQRRQSYLASLPEEQSPRIDQAISKSHEKVNGSALTSWNVVSTFCELTDLTT